MSAPRTDPPRVVAALSLVVAVVLGDSGVVTLALRISHKKPRRHGRANSDAERRALAKASGRRGRAGPPPPPRPGFALLCSDGGSRGNPGPAAIGYVLAAADGTRLAAHGEAIGVAGAREPANPRLRELCSAVRDAAERIGSVRFTWVPAEANADAHALVAAALDF